jgi:predicted alpha/beta superfamily hydrolase
MKSLFLLLCCCCIFFYSEAQQVEDNFLGQRVLLNSVVLSGEREIQVSLPEGYQDSVKDYPVLYLLDGQRWFIQAVSNQRIFSEYMYTPDFIVVGINTDDSPRFRFFANSDRLRSFLKDELIPFIEDNYRASNERLLFGWQFAGAFALDIITKDPTLFNSYLAASPIPLNNVNEDDFINGVNQVKSIFLTTSRKEDQVNLGVDKLVSLLNERASSSLVWKYKPNEMETISSFGHRTTPIAALYHGLRFHFSDYPLLEFDEMEEFESVGGFDYVTEYYKKRSEKYNVDNGIPVEGKFFLIRFGLDTDHFPTFKKFMDEFKASNYIENENMGWNTRYAEFYLKNGDTEGALYVYESLVKRFPESARPVNGLGDAYLVKGDLRKAKKYYKEAISIAEKSGDRRLGEYQEDLKSLENENK